MATLAQMIAWLRKEVDKYLPSDLIDLESLIDSTLTYQENKARILELLKPYMELEIDLDECKYLERKFFENNGFFIRENLRQLPSQDSFKFYRYMLPKQRRIIGLDIETGEDDFQSEIKSVQLYSDFVQRVFLNNERDSRDLLYYLILQNGSILACFNNLFDIPRLKKFLEENNLGKGRLRFSKNEKKVDLLFRTNKEFGKKRLVFKTHELLWFWGSAYSAGKELGIEKLNRDEALARLKRFGVSDKYFQRYALTDAKISYLACKRQQEIFRETIGVSSLAHSSRRFLKLNKVWKLEKDLELPFWNAYFGGISLAVKRGYSNISGVFYDFDSFYPCSLLESRSLCYSNIREVEDIDFFNSFDDYFNSEHRYLVHGIFKGTTFLQKTLDDGKIRLTPLNSRFQGYFWDSETIFLQPVEIFQVWKIDIKKRMIEEKLKKILEKKRKGGIHRGGYKLILNALYGVTAEHLKGRGICFNPAIAGATTALARSIILKLWSDNKKNFAYCDTDSILLLKDKKPNIDFLSALFVLKKEMQVEKEAIVRLKRYFFENSCYYKFAHHGSYLPENLLQELKELAFGKEFNERKYLKKYRITRKRADLKEGILGGFGTTKAISTTWREHVEKFFKDDYKLKRRTREYKNRLVQGKIMKF